MTFTKQILSGSTNGKQVKVTATTAGTAIAVHTATNTAGQLDEVYIYASNSDSSAHLLTILWGGATDADGCIKLSIPSQQGRLLVCDGMLLRAGAAVGVYADAANVVFIDGFVNNIAP